MDKVCHLIKLSVGTADVEELRARQYMGCVVGSDGLPCHVTRMWPRREEEVLSGGSIYWVIKGEILCRQRVVAFTPRQGEDGIVRCAISLDPRIQLVAATPRRAFQGWRYLAADDAPPDLGMARPQEEQLPASLQNALAELGVL